MKSAEQRIKEAFPDWKDWPEWAMGATVELVKEYGMDVAKAALIEQEKHIQCDIEFDRFGEGRGGVIAIGYFEIKTP